MYTRKGAQIDGIISLLTSEHHDLLHAPSREYLENSIHKVGMIYNWGERVCDCF